MSIFSLPDELLPKKAMLNMQTKDAKAEVPVEIASTFNLFAHPMAGVAAMSAIGIGFASQAMGIWFGALSGATVASQRLFSPMFDELETDAFREQPAPVVRAGMGAAKLAQAAEAVVVTLKPKQIGEPKAVSARNAPPVEARPAQTPSAPKADTGKTRKAKPSTVKAKPAGVETKVTQPAAAEAITAEVGAAATGGGASVEKIKPAMLVKPEQPDDLKAITGIGPKVEQVLNGLGIWTYAQIAAWNEAEAAWVDDMLGFGGRIGRDDWLGQAAKRAAAPTG